MGFNVRFHFLLKLFLVSLLVIFNIKVAEASTWLKIYKGDISVYDKRRICLSVDVSQDNSLIIGGQRVNNKLDYWVFKLDDNGNVSWNKLFDYVPFSLPSYEKQSDFIYGITRSNDGGYIIAGYTSFYGLEDGWILKLNQNGNILWHKTYDEGYSNDRIYSIQNTLDGGFILAGELQSFSTINWSYDIWVTKLDNEGRVLWSKAYGGPDLDRARAIHVTTDGGYIVVGENRYVSSNNVINNDFDIAVLRLDSNGNILWQKAYGGPKDDFAFSVIQTTDGGFIIVGETESFGKGGTDVLIMKLDAQGNIVWEKTYGGSGND